MPGYEVNRWVTITSGYNSELKTGKPLRAPVRIIRIDGERYISVKDIKNVIQLIGRCFAHKRDQQREILKHLPELVRDDKAESI